MAVYLNFDEVRPVIESYLISIKDGSSINLPPYENLYDLIEYANTKDEIKYISILYYAIKDLTTNWYSSTFHLHKLFKKKVELIEHRNYFHDALDFTPQIIFLTKDEYNRRTKRETEDAKGKEVIIIEDTFKVFANIIKYENPDKPVPTALDKKNLQRIKNNLDILFKKRNQDMPNRTFEYFIEWIKINNSTSGDPTPTISDDKIIKKVPKYLFDLWISEGGINHYDKVINYLKDGVHFEGQNFVTELAPGILKWNSIPKYLAGFWKTCRENNFINWNLPAKTIIYILGNTFSLVPPPPLIYFENSGLYFRLDSKYIEPFENLPGAIAKQK